MPRSGARSSAITVRLPAAVIGFRPRANAPAMMEALVSVSRAIVGADDSAEILKRAIAALARSLAADAAVAWGADGGDGRMRPIAAFKVARALRDDAFALPAAPFVADGVRPVSRAEHAMRAGRTCEALTLIPHRSLLLQPLEVHGQPGGMLGLFWKRTQRPPTADERKLLAFAARQIGIAIEKATLSGQLRALKTESDRHAIESSTRLQQAYDELRATREDLRVLSAQVDRVRERERARIAREIHDELGQALTALKIDLQRLSRDPAGDDNDATQLPAAVDGMIATVRRIASELRPQLLDDLGLVAALEWQAQDFVRRTGVKCRFRCRGIPDQLDQDRSMALFRIFQEVLTNIARHAGATQVQIKLTVGQTSARLEVADNGCGITPADSTRLGVRGMQERAAALGGRVVIGSAAPTGTTVRVHIPLRAPRTRKSEA